MSIAAHGRNTPCLEERGLESVRQSLLNYVMINLSLKGPEELAGVRVGEAGPISDVGNSTFKSPKYERCGCSRGFK